MKRTENVSLASLTTFKIGGVARTVFECATSEDIQTALAYARESRLPWQVVGGGSNILASDSGYDGVIIRPVMTEVVFEGEVIIADAGVSWDALVEETVMRELWGLENLAGIPGSVGAAPVQNIGAYGADVSGTLLYCDVLDTLGTEEPDKDSAFAPRLIRMTREDCQLGYRDSIFKQTNPRYIVLRVAFALTKKGTPHTSYADLTAHEKASGEKLTTPKAIADAVRAIRSAKFPDLSVSGTAGSFFKNPVIARTAYDALKLHYPELPGYPDGDDHIKVSLAWILDHILSLRGFTNGLAHVRLFERQPLVLVAEKGATASDVDALANEVARRVRSATGITIEREVRSLGE